MSVLPAVVLLVTLASPELHGKDPTPGSYHRYVRPPFEFFYAGMDASPLEKLNRDLRRIVPEMESRLGTRLPDRVRISLPLTRTEFVRMTGGRVPYWAGGVAYPGAGAIVVKAPTFFGEGVPMEVLVAHELAHILMDVAARQGDIPRWFEEGFAQLLAGESRTGSLGRLARAALADRLMGLPRVDNVLSFRSPDAELAYAESRAAAESLKERFGWEVIRAILYRVAESSDFPVAFQQSTGVEYEAWQADWLESAQKHYRNFAFLDVESLIWVLILLLSAAAVVAVWIRKRRQLRKWLTEEENEEDEPTPVDNRPITP